MRVVETQLDTDIRTLYPQYENAKWEEISKKYNEVEKPGDKALRIAAENGDLPIFGKHVAEKNYHYVVTGWHRFFEIFSSLPAEKRVFNEIIKEGQPFHFYMDLDLVRTINSEFRPGSEKEAEILEKVRVEGKAALLRCFPQVKEEDIRIVELDSSDLKKLSRHLIFKMKGRALGNWQTAYAVFDELVKYNDDPQNILWVTDEVHPDKKKYFIDRSVYTKNRQFRLYQSHKFGNYRFFHYPGFDNPGDAPNAEKFWDSLVSYFPPEEKARLLVLELAGSDDLFKKKKALRPAGTVVKKKSKTNNGDRARLTDGNWLTDELQNIFTDEVYKVQMKEGDNRVWFYVKSHDCQISGPHTSNHIKYLIDLTTRTYTQKCTSESCRGQSGPTEPIPESYFPSIDRYLAEQIEIRYASIFRSSTNLE